MSKKRSIVTIEKDRVRAKAWRLANSEQAKASIAQWHSTHPDYDRIKKKELRARYKEAVFALLGKQCANPNCRYLNEDGTLGCKDERLLHIDHINGGGRKEREAMANNVRTLHRKILKAEGKGYRILCANCNWLHRYEEF